MALDLAAIIVAGPFLMSLAAAMAMFIVYRALSRVIHARIWAVAFAVYALQWAFFYLPAFRPEAGITMSAGPVPVAGFVALLLFVEGFRVRANCARSGLPWLIGMVALLVSATLPLPAAWQAPRDALVPLLAAGLLIHAVTLVRRRRMQASLSEVAMMALLALLAVTKTIQSALALAELVGLHTVGPMAHAITALTWMPVVAALAMFTLLLIASDFSAELQRMVNTDPLTGVLNRAGFENAARLALRRARPARPVSLALADIDRFKAINDQHGHAIGDAALTCVATHLGATLSGDDLVGRIGGEEFAILFCNTDATAAFDRVEPIRASLPEKCSCDDAVTVSLGVAEQARGEELEALLERADRALYASKRGGRNRTTLAGRATPE